MLHLRKCNIHKGILFANKPVQPSLCVSFATQQSRQMPTKKKIELSDTPPTQYPPINPKLFDYEAQKGPKKHRNESNNNAINIGALFLFGGFICGGIISIFQPKDFRNDFKFYSALPDAYYTKNTSDTSIPINIQQSSKIVKEKQQDQAYAMTYSLFLGFGSGIGGNIWYRIWTHPLRIKELKTFELVETLTELRANYIRNCIKGTFTGCLSMTAMIYMSVFLSYLYIGQFYKNKYVDKSFWDYMELTYHRNIESRKEYEINLEFQERLNEKNQMLNPPIAPSLIGEEKVIINSKKDENENENDLKKFKAKRRDLYEKTLVGMEWNTDLYLNTKEISYFKLNKQGKAVRWNMAREMAMLACSCSVCVVVPVFLGINIMATRIYGNFWKQLIQQVIKTKQMPRKTY